MDKQEKAEKLNQLFAEHDRLTIERDSALRYLFMLDQKLVAMKAEIIELGMVRDVTLRD